jgi:hypothetical protein
MAKLLFQMAELPLQNFQVTCTLRVTSQTSYIRNFTFIQPPSLFADFVNRSA